MSSSIITILIVLFILFIFRRLDKSSFKLNKVKQYVERVVGRLEEYEKSWTEKVNVQEATLNELINRTETLNKTLVSKLEILVEKEQKIRNAESIIHETEANVSALLLEVGNVNKGMEQVRKTAQQVVDIEEHAKLLGKQLEKTLDSFKEKEQLVNESFHVKIESLKNQVQLTEKKLSEKVSAENITLMAIIKRMKETFSFSEKENLQRLQKMTQEINSKTDEALKESISKVHQLNETVKNIEVTHLTNKNMMLESFKDSTSQLEKKIEDTKSLFTTAMAEAQRENLEKVKELHQIMQKMTIDFGTDAEKHVDEIKILADDSKQAVHNVKSEMEQIKKQTLAEFHSGMSAMQKDLKEKESTVLKSIEEKINTFTAKLNELLNKYKEDKKTVEKTINDKLDEFNQKVKTAMVVAEGVEKTVDKGVEQAVKSSIAKFSEIEKKTNEMTRAGFEMSQKKLEERIALFTESINGILEKYKDDNRLLEKAVIEKMDEFNKKAKTTLNTVENAGKSVEQEIGKAITSTTIRLAEIEKKSLEMTKNEHEASQKKLDDKVFLYTENMNSLIEKYTEDRKTVESLFRERLAEFDRRSSSVTELLSNTENQIKESIDAAIRQATDLKLENMDEALQKNVAILNETALSAESRMKEDYDKIIHGMTKKIRLVQTEVNNVASKFTNIENQLLQNIRDRIENLDKEYKEKLQIVEKQFSDFEDKVSHEIAADITTFKKHMDSTLESSRKTENDLLKETREKLNQVHLSLKQFDERMGLSENDFLQKMQEKYQAVEDKLTQKMDSYEQKITERDKKNSERAKSEIEKMNTNIDKIKELIKKHEAGAKNQYTLLIESLEQTSSKLREKTEKSTQEFILGTTDKLKKYQLEIDNKLKGADESLDRIIGEARKRMQERVGKLHDEIKSMRDSAKGELTGFLTTTESRLAGLEEKSNDLTRKADDLEKNFESSLKSYVSAFNNQVANKIKEFTSSLKITEKATSEQVREFLDSLKTDYDNMKENYQTQSSKMIAEEIDKIEQLQSKISDVQKQMDYFLTQTKLFENANKMKTQLNEDIKKFGEYMKTLKDKKKHFDNFEAQVEKLDKRGLALQDEIDKITAERKKVDQVDEKVKEIYSMIKELDLKISTFKKEKDRINELSERFRELDDLVQKVNTQTITFSEKEEEMNRYMNILNDISSTYNKLDKSMDTFSSKVSKFEDKSVKLEDKIDLISKRQLELGAAEEQFKQLAERVDDIKPNLDYLDKQANRLDTLRNWANKTQGELESFLSDANEKIKILENLLEQISSTVQETRNARAKIVKEVQEKNSHNTPFQSNFDSQNETRVIKLYNQGMSAEDIARMLKLPLSEVKDIIKD